MIYCEVPLPEPARGAAFCAWRFMLEPDDPPLVQHQVPPDGTTNAVLVVTSAGARLARLVGPSLASLEVPVLRGWRYAGLRLRPEAARLVTGATTLPHTSAERDTGDALAPIWADLAASVGDGTDWHGTAALLAGRRGADRAVAVAVDALTVSGGTAPIPALARAAALGERHFRRRFLAATGIAPKQYADVQRVRHALIRALDDADWAGIAHDTGFADQPHLARDIKERFGAAPRRVIGYLGGIRHELLAPRQVRNVQDVREQAA